MNKLEKLQKLVLFEIALDLGFQDLINFCLSSRIINEKICNNQVFWMKKLDHNFGINKREDIPDKYILENGRLDYKKYYLEIKRKKEKEIKEIKRKKEEKEIYYGNLAYKLGVKEGDFVAITNEPILSSGSIYGRFIGGKVIFNTLSKHNADFDGDEGSIHVLLTHPRRF